MFDHLDDPQPYTPSPDLRSAVERRGRGMRRKRRVAMSSAAVVLIVTAGVVAAGATVDRKLDDVQRIDVAGLRTTAEPGDPKVLLFVGQDSDAGLETAERTGPFRGDTIVLARVDPGNETLTVLPVPRDLLVDIPGHGRDRANAALAFGGPDLLIETIHQNLGIQVDHYLQADFRGAMRIGDALGGLDLSFPVAVRDGRVGFEAPAGCRTYDGDELLAIARTRHLQYLQDDAWKQDPTSDLGRMERQQAVGAALLRKLSKLDATDPRKVNRLLDAAVKELWVDQETSSKDLLGLVRAIEGSEYQPLRYPLADHLTDGGAQVLLLGPGAGDVTAAFVGASTPQPPAGPTAGNPTGEPTATSTTSSTTSTIPADTQGTGPGTTATTSTTIVPSSTPAASVPTPC